MPHMSNNPFLIDTLMTIGMFVLGIVFIGICVYAAGLLWDGEEKDE